MSKVYQTNKSVLRVNGKDVVVEGHFLSYEERENLVVCTDKQGIVVSVENLSKDKVYNLFYNDELMTGLPPGDKLSFGSIRVNSELLKAVLKAAQPYEDDSEEESDEYFDCYD